MDVTVLQSVFTLRMRCIFFPVKQVQVKRRERSKFDPCACDWGSAVVYFSSTFKVKQDPFRPSACAAYENFALQIANKIQLLNFWFVEDASILTNCNVNH